MKLIQCPQCGGSDFEGYECEYCGAQFEPEGYEGPHAEEYVYEELPPERYADYSGASVFCGNATTCFAGPAEMDVSNVKFTDAFLRMSEFGKALKKIKRLWPR